MRPLYITQGASLGVFHRMDQVLKANGTAEQASWFVADKTFFDRFRREHAQDFEAAKVLKEWEIVADALANGRPAGAIGEWEKYLGIPTLWPAAIADRRLFMGRYCKAVQDYRPQYSPAQLTSIINAFCEAFNRVFTEQRPDVVFSFGPNTAGAMIGAYMARRHGIPFLTMKSTKISNLVSFSDEWEDRHPHIVEIFDRFSATNAMPEQASQFALKYLEEAASGEAIKYEGVLATRRTRRPAKLVELGRQILALARGAASDIRFISTGQFDPQRAPQIGIQYHLGIGRELRIRKAKRILAPRQLHESQLKDLDFIFYPLNSEPEIALSVYSRYFRNQIEVARSLAESLPMGIHLVIKDHPRSWGVRSPGYYRKLLEIPNVLIAPVEMTTSDIIRQAKAVAVLSSFVGFEALMQGKPVVLFGSCIYDFLPEPLVWKVPCMETLPTVLANACSAQDGGKDLIPHFLAAVREGSVPIDLYSSMLGKKSRALGTASVSEAEKKQYEMLAEYAMRRYAESVSRMGNRAS